ncbi:MAG: hypothetical protein ACKN9U_05050, partial [Pirellulaceae bacterium]
MTPGAGEPCGRTGWLAVALTAGTQRIAHTKALPGNRQGFFYWSTEYRRAGSHRLPRDHGRLFPHITSAG